MDMCECVCSVRGCRIVSVGLYGVGGCTEWIVLVVVKKNKLLFRDGAMAAHLMVVNTKTEVEIGRLLVGWVGYVCMYVGRNGGGFCMRSRKEVVPSNSRWENR